MFVSIDFFKTYGLETAGLILSVIYIYYSINRKLWLWVAGFFSSLIYVIIFYQNLLYTDMILNIYYAIISIYGFIAWKKDKENYHKETLQSDICQILPEQVVPTISIWVILFLIMFFSVTYMPEYVNLRTSNYPILDSFLVSLSVISAWMLTRKFIEQWLLWAFVNFAYILIYFYDELYITSFLSVIFTVMSVIGYVSWYKRLIIQERKKRRRI